MTTNTTFMRTTSTEYFRYVESSPTTHVVQIAAPKRPNLRSDSKADRNITTFNDFVSSSTVTVGDLTFVVVAGTNYSKVANRTNGWREFDHLLDWLDDSGVIINDLDDAGLTKMRSGWERRLQSLYELDTGD